MNGFLQGVVDALEIMIAIVIAFAIIGFFTMILWNSVVPYIFNLPHINFPQAICLNLLSYILFQRDVSLPKIEYVNKEDDT